MNATEALNDIQRACTLPLLRCRSASNRGLVLPTDHNPPLAHPNPRPTWPDDAACVVDDGEHGLGRGAAQRAQRRLKRKRDEPGRISPGIKRTNRRSPLGRAALAGSLCLHARPCATSSHLCPPLHRLLESGQGAVAHRHAAQHAQVLVPHRHCGRLQARAAVWAAGAAKTCEARRTARQPSSPCNRLCATH